MANVDLFMKTLILFMCFHDERINVGKKTEMVVIFVLFYFFFFFVARTCSTTGYNPSTFDYWYDKTTVSLGEEVVLTCKYTETRNITRRAICMFKGGITLFGGDDITTCPGK